MHRLTRCVVIAVLAAWLASPALGQPAEPPPEGARPGSAAEEARIRELVDREVARILTERAAKDAAERAAKEAADKEATANEPGELHGSSGFMDTRLAFTITNENMLAKPGETVPSAPGWRFGTPSSLGVLFFDNYDTRYSGFETLSHAVMYREYTRGHVQAEAGLVIRLDDLTDTSIQLSDDGTYLTVSDWKDPTHKDPTRISLTAFPLSSDRFRLGYSYRLSWGGNPEYRRTKSATPGVKLQYDGPSMYAFVGAKSSLVVDSRDGHEKAALAALAGAGVDVSPLLRIELNGGTFDRGYNEMADVSSKKVRLYGASVQASLHRGAPVSSSLDYRLYRFNGESVTGLFAPERYPGGLAWLAQAEFTVLSQTLKDPTMPGETVAQTGMAGDLNLRVKIDRLRLQLDLSYRDLAFILHTQPGFPPYAAFPPGYATRPDMFAAIGADRNWADWLTLGFIVGIEKPATLSVPAGNGDPPQTLVIRDNNVDTVSTTLPPGAEGAAQVAVKGTLKIDFAKVFSALLEVFYSRDRNQAHSMCIDVDQCQDVFGPPNQLGLNATLQARF
ncbi:MAG TPA: hypothetical protein VFD36_16915 [Kofleriaceae bacterium]|nr:hypothetical protein [Kofleriaceae bacterium]